MARPLRIEFEGALYHVMASGNARSDIFVDDEDRQLIVDNLGRVSQRGQVWFSALFGMLPLWPVRYESNKRALGTM